LSKLSLSDFTDGIIASHETRFNKEEKTQFLEYAKQRFMDLGYNDSDILIQKSFFGGRNLIIGSPDANIIITAHYDTPARNGRIALPFFNIFGMKLSSVLSLVYMIPLLYFLHLPSIFAQNFRFGVAIEFYIRNLWIFLFLAALMLFRNKHNHNDNTSGCVGVYGLATLISENPELKSKCAFILFDNEEKGLFGSIAYASWRKRNYPGKSDFRVYNLDCIGVGDILLIAAKQNSPAWKLLPELSEFFESSGINTVHRTSNVFGFMGDHASFDWGVVFTFVKNAKLTGLYIPNIHTSKDTVLNIEPIEYLCATIFTFISEQ